MYNTLPANRSHWLRGVEASHSFSIFTRSYRKLDFQVPINQGSPPPKHRKTNFPHLPEYVEPTTGVLSKLPRSWIPYAQLMRIDRPAGLYAFYFPYLIGVMYAACIMDSVPSPLKVIKLMALLLPYSILLRGIACTWNDNVDQNFDRQVERTRHRPIARGAVSTSTANIFTALQFLVWYSMLGRIFSPYCIMQAMSIVLLFLIYALMKRITYYPQVVLGFPFAGAIFLCVSVLDADPSAKNHVSTITLVGSNILWTIIYDTIYAHQDIANDERAGVKGMALRFRNSTKTLSSVLATGQLFLLILCGKQAGFSSYYQIGTVGGVGVSMTFYLYNVDLGSPHSCGAWFHRQFWLIGIGYMIGLTMEYSHLLCT